MFLNALKPSVGSKKKGKRVGRGIGSTLGKTCGRGHKGQKSRSGGFHKTGFEGGQMPLQRRLPKVGFASKRKKYTAQINLSELSRIDAEIVDLSVLKKCNLVRNNILWVKIFNSGALEKPVKLKGLKVTKGAKKQIESLGGYIEA